MDRTLVTKVILIALLVFKGSLYDIPVTRSWHLLHGATSSPQLPRPLRRLLNYLQCVTPSRRIAACRAVGQAWSKHV